MRQATSTELRQFSAHIAAGRYTEAAALGRSLGYTDAQIALYVGNQANGITSSSALTFLSSSASPEPAPALAPVPAPAPALAPVPAPAPALAPVPVGRNVADFNAYIASGAPGSQIEIDRIQAASDVLDDSGYYDSGLAAERASGSINKSSIVVGVLISMFYFIAVSR